MTFRPLLVFLVFMGASIPLLHQFSWDKGPYSFHSWAQSDHLALAYGFLDNGFDFFHPSSYALSHQFPPQNPVADPQGITSADFPILPYVAAIGMNIVGTQSPALYRGFSLLFSLCALGFAFIFLARGRGIWAALFFVGFIQFQPIFAFYQNGFHVSTVSFSAWLVGATCLFRYFQTGSNRTYLWGVLFFTIAALMRFTHVISLLALGLVSLIFIIRQRKWDKRAGILAGAFAVILVYFFYNRYLTQTYGTLFLGKPLPSKDWASFAEHVKGLYHSYKLYFLPSTHFWPLLLLLTFSLFKGRKAWNVFSEKSVWFLSLLGGVSAFTLLMTWSIMTHDYYSLDTWTPLLVAGLWVAMFRISQTQWSSWPARIAVMGFLLVAGYSAWKSQAWRYGPFGQSTGPTVMIRDMTESREMLDQLIPVGKKVLIITADGWNTPMLGWPRKAYIAGWKHSKEIPQALEKQPDFIVTQNRRFQEIVTSNYPEFEARVTKVQDNGVVTVWKLNPD